MQPRAKKRNVKEVQEVEKSKEEEEDDDEYYPVQPQQSRLCSPETVIPACTTIPQEPECIQSKENVPPQQEKEQGLTNQENLPELEDNYIEEPPVEADVPSPAPSVSSYKELQRPRRQHRWPKVFTYDRLGSPACYKLRTLQLHTNCRMPWTYSMLPYHFRH